MSKELQNQLASIKRSAELDPRFKHNDDVEITQEAAGAVDVIFKSMLPHFPAWRQSCPTDEDLGRLKAAWTKAIIRHSRKTGKKPNFKAGITACEESETDWLPSVGKFLKWCNQDDDITQLAERALSLFNSGQRQIDNVGLMVTSKHGFDLKHEKASETNKKFIELYLKYASNCKVEPLEQSLLTDSVQLTPEQEREAKDRADKARDNFLSEFGGLIKEKTETPITKPKCKGVQKQNLRTHLTQSEIEAEKKRQLKELMGK